MKLINYLFNKIPLFTALLAGLALSSCGSYQYVGQSSDGIYQTTTENVEQEPVAIPAENNNDYYSNYFKEKALEAEMYNDSDDVFTDIDSYQGSYDETLEETNQNAGWGTSNETVVINIHDNGFYNNYGWAYNNWGWNRPWGYNRFGWNSWNSPYAWNYGWGYSGFYNSYWNNLYYGHGYGYGYAYHNGFRRRGLAYNTGRRGSYYRNSSYLNSRSSRINTRNNSVRPRTNTTRTRTRTRTRTNTTRPRTNTTRPRTNTTRPRTNSSTPRSNSSTPRSSSPSRSTPRNRSTSSGSSRRGRG